jgi:tRNA-Thr(GGU) m(6)t(6)A37 methyltransferase TsaA
MKHHFVFATVALFFTACSVPLLCWGDPARETSGTGFVVQPIGRVEKADDRTEIVLDKKYQPGLLGLNGFSHVYVFWWFDKNDTPAKRSTLQVHPRGNNQNPLTGVFATRSPLRPNLIGMTLCKVLSVKENVVTVEKIDAFPGTSVLDIKPFIPGYDSVPDARVPEWADKK